MICPFCRCTNMYISRRSNLPKCKRCRREIDGFHWEQKR